MKISRAFRFRLYPTDDQAQVFGQWSGACRFLYNCALEQRRDFWRQYRRTEGRSLNFPAQSAELKHVRAQFDWMAAVPSDALNYALRDIDKAFSNFFAGRSRYPRLRRRSDGHGFRVKAEYAHVRQVSARWAEVRLPKLGWVRFRATRPIRGTVRNIAVSCASGQWHVVFAADWEQEAPAPAAAEVGLDLGIARTVTLSTGEHFSQPATERLQRRIKRAQKVMARRRRGSKRHAQQVHRLASLRAREARVRADWRHKTTTRLALRFGLIVAEDLNIRGMSASAAGTAEQPGTGVAQKRGLNRAIQLQGWGLLLTQLSYKTKAKGGVLIRVDPRHSSQTCASCGVVDARSRESQARFQCIACGHTDNADANAAKNLLRRGTASTNVETGAGRSMKRQSEELCHV